MPLKISAYGANAWHTVSSVVRVAGAGISYPRRKAISTRVIQHFDGEHIISWLADCHFVDMRLQGISDLYGELLDLVLIEYLVGVCTDDKRDGQHH